MRSPMTAAVARRPMSFPLSFPLSSAVSFAVSLALSFSLAGCGGDHPSAVSGASDQLTCQSPAGVSVAPDAAVAGCFRTASAFQICDPTTCKDACGPSDFSMTCIGPTLMGPIPEPDAALGCTVIPIPTPSDALFYCCPCAK
jgi:hypothetical protein